MPSTVTAQRSGLFVKAYRGDAMTLLAMNMAKEDIKPDFVGFTIGFSFPGETKINYLYNRINFGDNPTADVNAPEFEQDYTPSDKAPFQYFRWIHVPGARFIDEQGHFPFGEYTYYITPRYFGTTGLEPIDDSRTCQIKIEVAPFRDRQIEVSFTRGFVTSQAFVHRFGRVKIKPDNLDNFDVEKRAGIKEGRPFTYREMYEWLGYQARVRVLGVLDEVLKDNTLTIDVLAYDLDEPTVSRQLLELARQGRMRMVLDDSIAKNKDSVSGHGAPDSEETKFANKASALHADCVRRTHFKRFAHCKVFIVKKNGVPQKVLTGSTNFSINGLYVNANHVVVITDRSAANLYTQMFEEAWSSPSKFSDTELANGFKLDTVPGAKQIEFAFSPHKKEQSVEILNTIAEEIKKAAHSVLFSVMGLSTSTGELIDVLKNIETTAGPQVFKYGVSEQVKEVKFYKPGKKNAIIINAKSIVRDLPPPFDKEVNPSGIKIHHKFVVKDFDTPNALVICGSSNLALGGESANNDNLIVIRDRELATVFAIEAIRLVDHYHFRAKRTVTYTTTPTYKIVLRSNNSWTAKFYDPNDLKYLDRNLFAPMP